MVPFGTTEDAHRCSESLGHHRGEIVGEESWVVSGRVSGLCFREVVRIRLGQSSLGTAESSGT